MPAPGSLKERETGEGRARQRGSSPTTAVAVSSRSSCLRRFFQGSNTRGRILGQPRGAPAPAAVERWEGAHSFDGEATYLRPHKRKKINQIFNS